MTHERARPCEDRLHRIVIQRTQRYKVQVHILRGYYSEDRISYIQEKFIFTSERMFCEAQRLQTETDDLFRHQTDLNIGRHQR